MTFKDALQMLLNIVNKVIPKVNITVNVQRKTYFKKNVFNTNYGRHSLVSYLSTPFIGGLTNNHTNHKECYFAAEALSQLGFDVDVVDYDHYQKISYEKYSVLYGFGNQLEQSFFDKKFKGKRIVYSPGCNTVYSNLVSCERLLDFQSRGGNLDPKLIRTTDQAWPLQKYLSDAIICQGNAFVLNSYKESFDKLNYYQINCFPLNKDELVNEKEKEFRNIKHNLLWFGSQGSVHKGLDIALTLIERNPKLKLFVRGLKTKHESSVIDKFKHLISTNQLDVETHVDINSKDFEELLANCGAVIFPSASEGGAAALLTVMAHGGLIPIITKACGLDINHLGFVADETTILSVENQLNLYLNTSDEKLKELAKKVKVEINTTYNTYNYQKNLKTILRDIIH